MLMMAIADENEKKPRQRKKVPFDVASVPPELRYVDIRAVMALLSLSEKTIERMVLTGEFPKPRKLNGNNRRWLLAEVFEYIRSLPHS